MTLSNFIKKVDFSKRNELDKFKIIYYYLYQKENSKEIDIKVVAEKLTQEGFSNPNLSRLKQKLSKSKDFLKGSNGSYRLHQKTIEALNTEFSFFTDSSEEIITENGILPKDLYSNTRGYIEKLALQINASYENNISDGCAVLMRRLLEVLLLLAIKCAGKESDIKDLGTGQYKNLTSIINYTISNKVLSISKDTEGVLHDFRELGNFSAHAIHYNCRKEEITTVKRSYRYAVEDLLYAAGIKK
jgi:hypothetical protein